MKTMVQQHLTHQLDFEAGEILNINKPEGWTSFDVVNRLRKHIKIKKVGHAGTLDPFASGVLLVCTGKATKKVPELMKYEKEYLAEIELGKTTDTYDRTGVFSTQCSSVSLTEEKVNEICAHFKGESYQIPPMYSAIKVDGVRLYKLARQGKTVERSPRKIIIYEIEVINYKKPVIDLRVVCSKGTYIRTLAHDIGEMAHCGAYLKSLVRTRIGKYKIDSAYTIANFIQQN